MKLIRLSYPLKKSVNMSVVEINPKKRNIYELVEFYKGNIFPRIKCSKGKIKEKIKLKKIINLHNIEGLEDIYRIREMLLKIKKGKDILQKNNMPNIKLIKIKNKILLFDGHHSLLAYMTAGKKYLYEVPHILIDNANDAEVKVFFGKHSKKINDWRDYVINWQAENQICKKMQRNMGELLIKLNSRIKLI